MGLCSGILQEEAITIVRMFVFVFPGTLNRKLQFISESCFYYDNTGNN